MEKQLLSIGNIRKILSEKMELEQDMIKKLKGLENENQELKTKIEKSEEDLDLSKKLEETTIENNDLQYQLQESILTTKLLKEEWQREKRTLMNEIENNGKLIIKERDLKDKEIDKLKKQIEDLTEYTQRDFELEQNKLKESNKNLQQIIDQFEEEKASSAFDRLRMDKKLIEQDAEIANHVENKQKKEEELKNLYNLIRLKDKKCKNLKKKIKNGVSAIIAESGRYEGKVKNLEDNIISK